MQSEGRVRYTKGRNNENSLPYKLGSCSPQPQYHPPQTPRPYPLIVPTCHSSRSGYVPWRREGCLQVVIPQIDRGRLLRGRREFVGVYSIQD